MKVSLSPHNPRPSNNLPLLREIGKDFEFQVELTRVGS